MLRALRLIKLARLIPAALVAAVPDVPAARMESWARDHALLLVDRAAVDAHRQVAARRLVRAAWRWRGRWCGAALGSCRCAPE